MRHEARVQRLSAVQDGWVDHIEDLQQLGDQVGVLEVTDGVTLNKKIGKKIHFTIAHSATFEFSL